MPEAAAGVAGDQRRPVGAHRQTGAAGGQHQPLAHPLGLRIADVNAPPLSQVVRFEELTVAIGHRLVHRHAGDQLHGERPPQRRQLQHRAGAAHIGGRQLAVGRHLAELGPVVQDAADAASQGGEHPLRQPEPRQGQITGNRLDAAAPALLPEAVELQVAAQPRSPLIGIGGPHQNLHLQRRPALQLPRQQIGPEETGTAGEQDRLAGRGGRWQGRQRPALGQPGLVRQIEHRLTGRAIGGLQPAQHDRRQRLKVRVTRQRLQLELHAEVLLDASGQFHRHQRIQADLEQRVGRVEAGGIRQPHHRREPLLQQLQQGSSALLGRQGQQPAALERAPGRLIAAGLIAQQRGHGRCLPRLRLSRQLGPVVGQHGQHSAAPALQGQLQGRQRLFRWQQAHPQGLKPPALPGRHAGTGPGPPLHRQGDGLGSAKAPTRPGTGAIERPVGGAVVALSR